MPCFHSESLGQSTSPWGLLSLSGESLTALQSLVLAAALNLWITSLPKICAPVPSHFLPGNVTFWWDWSCHSLLFPTDKGCPLSSELAALGPSSASVEESESQRAKWLLACSEHHAHREMWFDDVTLCVHARNRLYERFHLFPSML